MAAILDFLKSEGVGQGDLIFFKAPWGYLSENKVKYSGALLFTESFLATRVIPLKVVIFRCFHPVQRGFDFDLENIFRRGLFLGDTSRTSLEGLINIKNWVPANPEGGAW